MIPKKKIEQFYLTHTWCNVTPLPPHTFITLLTIALRPVGDQLVVPRWVTHISCHYKNSIEGTGENKTNEQTRTICLGLTQEQKESYATLCIPDSIYGLTLAWVTSEISTKQLECRHLDSIFFTVAGPSCHAASPLCSGVHCRPPLSVSRCQLLSAPFPNQLSFRVPLPLPDTARFQVQKPFLLVSCQNRQRNRLLGGPPT